MIPKCCRCFALLFAALVVAVALVAGVYSSELSAFRNNSPGALWVNWIGELACGTGTAIERPATLDELQRTIRSYSSVRAAATGHSFNRFACPEKSSGAVVDMRAFRKVEVAKREDSAGYQVTAEAGIKMGQLQNEILAKGLTLRVPPGNSAYTLGGCLATGCHNLGQSHVQDLLALTIVRADGEVRSVKRGDPDFAAAAVSVGRLGVILNATLEVLPYRSLQWKAEQLEMQSTPEILKTLHGMTTNVTSTEHVGNKLVFYLATGVMMMEHWVPMGRAADVESSGTPLPPYVNPQPFRVGQGPLTRAYGALRSTTFTLMPGWLLSNLQVPAETIFRSLHSSAWLSGLRWVLGWQHSPEARGEASSRPSGNQYTWAGWLDETMNLIMGLRHIEVIFPLEPTVQAERCLDAVFAHRHLAWWRLNIRTQKSESFFLSSTHAPAGAKPVTFLRVDFVSPGPLMDLASGEASLTAQLHRDCPGWRKHWGKGLFATSAEERWGEPEAFKEVADRWDPAGKFRPLESPSWLA